MCSWMKDNLLNQEALYLMLPKENGNVRDLWEKWKEERREQDDRICVSQPRLDIYTPPREKTDAYILFELKTWRCQLLHEMTLNLLLKKFTTQGMHSCLKWKPCNWSTSYETIYISFIEQTTKLKFVFPLEISLILLRNMLFYKIELQKMSKLKMKQTPGKIR